LILFVGGDVALVEMASKFFRYSDLIECGSTWDRFGVDNWPKRQESYAGIQALCIKILDPVVDRFGPATLTFGFASAELDRMIREHNGRPNTTRRGDQHAGHELNREGRPYCPRLGQACDFRIQGVSSRDVAKWLVANVPFDRLYWYGNDRPIHVSYGPYHSRVMWRLPKDCHPEHLRAQ
jgi:hypothetical protein